MRLADFIRNSSDAIIADWETFARTMPAAGGLDLDALREHARQMLVVIADDLDEPQSSLEQFHKARGRSDATRGPRPTAAQAHGADRAAVGFTVDQMVAEFRALRASVIGLWLQRDDVSDTDLQDMIRFNEAIDQALAESVKRFSSELERAKKLFLAMLGHNLTTPLNAVLTSSVFMIERGELAEPYGTLVSGIAAASRRMTRVVGDLRDFTRTRFGDAMPVVMEDTDVRLIIHAAVAELGAAHPDRVVQIETSGLLRGECDPHRIAQALTNLLANAVQHGDPQTPIKVSGVGTRDHCVLSVQNYGSPVPAERIATLFEPANGGDDRRHLGLGLYIVDKILAAHGGKVTVQSDSASGTTVEMHLPL